MSNTVETGAADFSSGRLRFSVSLVKQGKKQFYTLTMPSEVLARTCKVTTRREDPSKGFQRNLDPKRAQEIADYIDTGTGTIPNSIVLSAQEAAQLKVVGKGKTLEFTDTPDAFLVLDGQHRVFGFSLASTSLRVPVVIYNGLSRTEEVRLFIDINTKQRPVPPQLLLDIKMLAETENETEEVLRSVFDYFEGEDDSALLGFMSPSEAARNKITRVTFNQAVKPLLTLFPGKEAYDIYRILNAYITALSAEVSKKSTLPVLAKPVVFRAFMGFFRPVAQRMVDRFGSNYSAANFQSVVEPVFANMQIKKLEKPGTSWAALRDYLEVRLVSKLTL
ncbi:hypothetical protein DC366_08230 [Pelagivirga sediminicola]|uniref:DGQHR domain-containing protein n=1 Tax=Pelagivirga sediminicola TaxID=2170575 RepID=A0A2T7G8V5_9RHOB|nr:DGQHR domain-containing protein [Pelagivirga sediminicola]PVA10836.1 hypothetical protein DC366_08230 [Pelagivirga sediminicola]